MADSVQASTVVAYGIQREWRAEQRGAYPNPGLPDKQQANTTPHTLYVSDGSACGRRPQGLKGGAQTSQGKERTNTAVSSIVRLKMVLLCSGFWRRRALW